MGYIPTDGSKDQLIAGASPFSTYQNLVKPFIGAGILALPNAFGQGGVVGSTVLLLLLSVMTLYCIRCLVACADRIQFGDPDESPEAIDISIDNSHYHGSSSSFSSSSASSSSSSSDHSLVHRRPSLSRDDGANNTDNDDDEHDERTRSRRDKQSLIRGSVRSDDVSFSSSPSSSLSPSSSSEVVGESASPHQHRRGAQANGSAADASNDSPLSELDLPSVDLGGDSSAPRLSSGSAPTYAQVGYLAFGRWGRVAVRTCLMVSQLGAGIAYVSFISQNMHAVIPSVSRGAWVWTLFPLLSALVQIRNIRLLAPTSALGNLVYLFSLCTIFFYGFRDHCCTPSSELDMWQWSGLPFMFGTATFALEGIALVLPVRSGMKDVSVFSSVMKAALVSVCFLYLSFSFLCVLFFGKETHAVITRNLAAGALTDSVRVSLSVSLFFTYAIQLYPVSELFDNIFWPKASTSASASSSSSSSSSPPLSSSSQDEEAHSPLSGRASRRSGVRRVVLQSLLRVALVAVTVLVTFAFSDFGLLISLIGCLSNAMLAFILPSLFYMRICRPRVVLGKTWWKHVAMPSFVVVVGSLASVVGVYFTLNEAADDD